MTTEERLRAKLPGDDTGIIRRDSFCDICAPGPHCGVTCYVKDGRIIKLEGTDDHPTNHGLLCARGQAGRQYVYRPDRVLTPLRRVGQRGEGKFLPITWEEAFDEIAARLNGVKERFGPSAAAFFSGYAKWYRPFLQRLCYSFGSVNYGTESSTCFTSTVMSWNLATGEDFVGPDLARAGVLLGWCCNPYYSNYLMARGLDRARERGMKIILIDPRVTAAADLGCDLHLRPRPGTDCALALGLARELIVRGWTDRAYIEENVYGYGEFAAYVMDFSPRRVEELTGVPAAQVEQAARMIHENGPLAINQAGASMVHHVNGLQTHRAIMALSALTGSYDRPGGLIPAPLTYAHSMAGFSTRDHEFAWETYPQGQPRPVGCEKYPLWERLVGEMQATELAAQILTQKPYPVKALWAHGLNYRMFNGDQEFEKALRELDFFVDVDLFLTDTAKLADLVLPCCSSLEREEFKVFQGGYAQWTEPVIPPLGQSRPDDEILFELARRIAPDDRLLVQGADACVRWMLEGTGVDVDALKRDRQRPHRQADIRCIPVGQHAFRTPTGKFELYSTVLAEFPGLDPLPTWKDCDAGTDPKAYPFRLVTGARLPGALHSRLHDVPWARALQPTAVVELHPAEGARLGAEDGDRVRLTTPAGSIVLPVRLTLRVPEGTAWLYHGYREADANSIIPPGYNDPYSGFPGYRSARCAVAREV